MSSPKMTVEEVNATALAVCILGYFDSYKLGSIAPIVCELEKALDQEYRRGVEEAGCLDKERKREELRRRLDEQHGYR